MKSNLRFAFALPLIMLVPPGSVSAQNALVLSKLAEWNDAAPLPGDEALRLAIRKTAQEIYGTTATCSVSDMSIGKVEPATADRYIFNGRIRGNLRNGWFATVQMAKCDTAPVRFMIIQQADASLKAIRVNRGLSHAWESLIADTFMPARLAADAALQRKGLNCSADAKAALGIVRISSEEPDLGPVQFGIRYKGSWTEIWPVQLCGHTVEIAVAFTADGDGGAYHRIAGDRTRVLP